MRLDLDCRGGLYYCPMDVLTVNRLPAHRPEINCSLQHHPLPHLESQPLVQYMLPVPKMAIDTSKLSAQQLWSPALLVTLRCPSWFTPTFKSKQVESEVWYSVWVLRESTNWTSFLAMSLAFPRFLNIIPSDSLTLRNKPGFGNKLPNARRYTPRIAGNVIIWILASCVPLLHTIPTHKMVRIGWFACMRALHHTF